MSPRGAQPKGTCLHCGGVVEAFHESVRQATGYIADREGGGANHLLRKTLLPRRIWHRLCWEDCMATRDGRGVQGDLFANPSSLPAPLIEQDEHTCIACRARAGARA